MHANWKVPSTASTLARHTKYKLPFMMHSQALEYKDYSFEGLGYSVMTARFVVDVVLILIVTWYCCMVSDTLNMLALFKLYHIILYYIII